jgi:hypothetical protein
LAAQLQQYFVEETTMPSTKRKPTARRAAVSRNDAISLLKRDHETVRGLLNRLDATTERAGSQRKELLHQIDLEIRHHSRIEEEIFYPAFKEAARKADQDLYYEAHEEHHVVTFVLMEIKVTSVDTEVFSAKAKVLKDLVEHHAEEEETQMFPKARQVMSPATLRELGARIQRRKQELESSFVTRIASTAGRTIGRVLPTTKKRAA